MHSAFIKQAQLLNSVLYAMSAVMIGVLGICFPSSVLAEEFSLFGGMIKNSETGNMSYSWQLEYLERLNKHLAVSLSYVNEGHVPSHHRDGHAVSLWASTPVLNSPLRLSAGVGTYFYYDTTAAKGGGDYSNSHGLGMIYSLAATWKSESRFQYQLRSNVIKAFNSIDSYSLLFGVGYDLQDRVNDGDKDEAIQIEREIGRNQFTIFGGQTIVNSFNSEKSIATSLEYRRSLMRFLDGTVSWIYEGDNRLLRRNGITPQLWLVDVFLEEKIELGVGAGAYFSVDRYRRSESKSSQSNRSLSGIVTLTAAYRFFREWGVRASWHRIVSGYDRDTDILLGGISYRF